MKKLQLIYLIAVCLLLVSCKVEQVDLSKVYETSWGSKEDNGIESELRFYKDNSATLMTVSIIQGQELRSVTKFSFRSVKGKLYLTPNNPNESVLLYADIEGDKLKLTGKGKDDCLWLKKQEW